MILSALALASVLRSCALREPQLLASAQVGVVEVESGAHPYALHDNNTGRSFYPADYASALALANDLIAADIAIDGRGIDVGLAQIDSHNFSRYGLTAATALQPCRNVAVSSDMLDSTYADELQALRPLAASLREYVALDRTLETYNSGVAYGAPSYTAKVEGAAQGAFAQSVLAYWRDTAQPKGFARTMAAASRRRNPPRSCFIGCATSLPNQNQRRF